MNRYQLKHVDHWVVKPGQVWFWTDDPRYEVTIVRDLGYFEYKKDLTNRFRMWKVKGNKYYEANNRDGGDSWYTEENLISGFTLKPEKKPWFSRWFR